MSKWLVLAASLALTGCFSGSPSCNYSGKAQIAPSAGCLIVDANRILLVEARGGKLGPPGGGVVASESAQCGAERETWEETGLEVRAGKLAKVFDNEFHLYWCEVVGPQKPAVQDPLEVASVDYYPLEEFPALRWRFPDQAAVIYELLDSK